MATINCDHCLIEIKSEKYLSSSNIYWCLNCLMDGGRELLKSYGIILAHPDQFYKDLGYTAWGYADDKIKKVPQKNVVVSAQPIISTPDVGPLPLEVKLPEVCKLKYYGVGPCSCGVCPKRHVPPFRNVFGY